MEAVKEDTGYTSPAYKLLAFFEESRDRWKTKALEREKRVRQLEKRVVELKASRRKWKEKAQARPASPIAHDDGEQKRA